MKKIMIVGATSAIAIACARLWAQQGASFYLVARNEEKLKQVSADLTALGAGAVHYYSMDCNHIAAHEAMFEDCVTKLQQIEVGLIAHGTLPDQARCEQSAEVAIAEFTTNGLSVIALLTGLANRMESQHFGTIAVISSVAADRGRPSNYLYGSAKAAVVTFCEGLNARMFKKGIQVLTIKPGFVDTPMTQGLPLPAALVVSPEVIANYILKAIAAKKSVIYAPWFWFWIMTIIRCVPNFIFRRLNL